MLCTESGDVLPWSRLRSESLSASGAGDGVFSGEGMALLVSACAAASAPSMARLSVSDAMASRSVSSRTLMGSSTRLMCSSRRSTASSLRRFAESGMSCSAFMALRTCSRKILSLACLSLATCVPLSPGFSCAVRCTSSSCRPTRSLQNLERTVCSLAAYFALSASRPCILARAPFFMLPLPAAELSIIPPRNDMRGAAASGASRAVD
mmetsp:Transcript_25009/g.78329  ORF Transcript_25009/g.78329 Transcript_25009/m.78329 type:complete len:208 (+) Transcript_25009:329-952(+)